MKEEIRLDIIDLYLMTDCNVSTIRHEEIK